MTSDDIGTDPVERGRGGVPRALILLGGGAAAVIVAAGVASVGWLVGPVMLALVVVITVRPVDGWMRRRGLPGWAASILLVVLVYAVVVVLAGIIVVSIARLATLLRSTAPRPASWSGRRSARSVGTASA